MSTNRRRYTPEFKADAVQLVVQAEQSIAQVARNLEINESSLGYWVKNYRQQHPEPAEAARIARLKAREPATGGGERVLEKSLRLKPST